MGNPGVGWAFVAGLDFLLNTGGEIPKEFPDRCRVKLTCTGGKIPKEEHAGDWGESMLVMEERACWLWGREHAGYGGESMLVMRERACW